MSTVASVEYKQGVVVDFKPRSGYGFIRPDDADDVEDLLLVHRKSLRDPDYMPEPDDRVLYFVTQVPRGLLAADVHLLPPNAESLAEAEDRQVGVVTRTQEDRGFAVVELPGHRTALLHVTHLDDGGSIPPVGSLISCRPVLTEKGLQALDASIESYPVAARLTENGQASSLTDAGTDALLAAATLARDARQYDKAVELYEQGLKNPSVQLILSYAAMQKNRGLKLEAMRIYEEGIRKIPEVAKLKEDAGVLAASLGSPDKAIRLLNDALDQVRHSKQGGEKGILLGLARVNYKTGSYRDAAGYYQTATSLLRKGKRDLSQADLLAFQLSEIHHRHHRGDVAIRFATDAALTIHQAALFEVATEGAYLVVSAQSEEIRESYGITGRFLLVSVFKSTVDPDDLAKIDGLVARLVERNQINDELVLLVTASLPLSLQQTLSRRIEDRSKSGPAVVPFPQEEAEIPQAASRLLQETLSRWLYRRDLFAVNTPVVGRRFFGRHQALDQLRESIASGSGAGVFGLRKIGKTSILKEVARRQAEVGDIVILTDLLRVPAGLRNADWLYWKIAGEMRKSAKDLGLRVDSWHLGGQYEVFLDIPHDFPVAAAFDADLTRTLRAIDSSAVSPRPRLVLMLDEIERLVPRSGDSPGLAGSFEFLSYLRGMSQERDDFVVIVSGANAAITELAHFGGDDNPLFNFFSEVYLQLLDLRECEIMMQTLGRGMGIRFTRQSIEEVYTLTGGHPFFTRQMCSFLANRMVDRPVTVTGDIVARERDAYLEVSGKDFREIMERLYRDYRDEAEVVVQLAKQGGRMPLRDARALLKGDSTLRHLLGYQIVRLEQDEIVMSMGLLLDWLRKDYAD